MSSAPRSRVHVWRRGLLLAALLTIARRRRARGCAGRDDAFAELRKASGSLLPAMVAMRSTGR